MIDTWINAFVIICEATPTMFFELVNSFFEEGSGKAFAEAVIHSINKKPAREEKRIHKNFAPACSTFL